MIKDTDDRLKNNLNYSEFNLFTPSYYAAIPTSNDYEFGYVLRYFVSKKNQPIVIETNSNNFNRVNTDFYNKAYCMWKITGAKNDKYDGKIKVTDGVEEHNRGQVILLKTVIPNIEKYLTNLLQFWRGY